MENNEASNFGICPLFLSFAIFFIVWMDANDFFEKHKYELLKKSIQMTLKIDLTKQNGQGMNEWNLYSNQWQSPQKNINSNNEMTIFK